MKRLLAVAACASALAMAPAAQAGVVFEQIDNTDLANIGSSTFSATLTDEFLAFNHVFGFNIGPDSLAIASITSNILGENDIDFSSIFLDGFAFTQTGSDPGAEQWELAAPVVLAPGAHSITVNGQAATTGDGTYSGVLNVVTAPIPEPATWMMMLLGFGAVGFMMRRGRNRTTTRVRYLPQLA